MENNKTVIIALGGEPASGKTTLLKRVRQNFATLTTFKQGLVCGSYCPSTNVYFVGVFDNTMFEGTDKLSLSVQPSFIEFVKNTNNAKIVFEGDRLFNASLFEQLPSIIFILDIDKTIHAQRHAQRGHAQNETFLKGRKTKIANVKNTFTHTILNNNTNDDIETNTKAIMEVLLMQNIDDNLLAQKITIQNILF
jgi:dephospho-CoA kinase